MQKGFFKKKVARCVAMTLIGCMLLGSTSMAATPYSFSIKKGEYGKSGYGAKTRADQYFEINVTSYNAEGIFFLCPRDDRDDQVGPDVTITGVKNYNQNTTYYKTTYTGHTYHLEGFYDDLQGSVSNKCSCSGTWIP